MSKKFQYSDFEKQKNKELNSLFSAWIKQLSKNTKSIKNGDKGKRTPTDCFAKDGFFPGYFDKKNLKVCFIGRETRRIGGLDFRDTTKDFFESFLDDPDHKNIKENSWWRRILRIVYGIKNNGEIKFEKLLEPMDILKKMYNSNKYGFATINLSIYSNDHQDQWESDNDLINRFLKDSELNIRNYFDEELKILDPDVIITANLWESPIKKEYLNLCLPDENFLSWKSLKDNVAAYGYYDLHGKKIMCINLYHFSAPGKTDKEYYYNPVMKILFNQNKK